MSLYAIGWGVILSHYKSEVEAELISNILNFRARNVIDYNTGGFNGFMEG